MHRLSASDLQNVMEQIRRAYAVSDMDRFPAEIPAIMRRLVDCDSIGFDDLNLRKHRIVGITDPPEARCEEHLPAFEHHMHEHPGIAHYQRESDPRTCKVSDFVSRSEWHGRGVYQEFYRYAGVEDQMGFWLRFPQPHMLAMVFQRSRRSFTERDRTLLDLMRPHLAQSYENAEAFTEARVGREMLWELIESGGRAVILLDSAGQMHALTAAAGTWLARYFPGWRRAPSRLPDALARWAARRRDELAGDEPSRQSAPEVFAVHHDRERLAVRMSAGPGGRTLLLLEEQRDGPVPPSDLQAEAARLPPRLYTVLQELLTGKAEKQIAADLQLSRHTVHEYVKRIYARLGTGSRSELMTRWIR